MSNKESSQPNEEEAVDFESALEQLESLVASMESGDLTLEQSLAAFEEGVALTKKCQKALQDARDRIDQLEDD